MEGIDEQVTHDEMKDDPNDDIGEDDQHRDASSRSSKYSDYEDDSMFEPDLDYEPEEESNEDEEVKKEEYSDDRKHFSDDSKEKLVSESSKRRYLSSDDDDIEVIDVINNETSIPKEVKAKEERKEHTKGRNYSGTIVKEEEAYSRSGNDAEKRSRSRSSKRRSRSRSLERSGRSRAVSRDMNVSSTRRSTKQAKSPERDFKKSDRGRRDSHHQELKEIKYSREELEKVKAFFSGNQNKRKDSDRNKMPAKKFKGDDGREWKDSKDDWLKDKLRREGKVFIQNYIPFPSSQKSNFKIDIKNAFKDELNEDILITLTPTYCGLCFKDFDDDVVAWKHFTGTNHKGTIKRFNRGTYKGHPPFWRMVHERLCEKDPAALTDQEIFDQVCENYNVGDNKEKVMYLVKRNIDCLMQYDQIGLRNNAYYIKNKNVQEVRKIFENYFFDKKRKEEREHEKKFSREEPVSSHRKYEERSTSSNRRSFDGRSSSRSHYSEDRNRGPSTSRHSYSSGYPARHQTLPYGDGRNPANQMLVVDPSKLRMLPNGQIMIKPDDVMSMRPGEVV